MHKALHSISQWKLVNDSNTISLFILMENKNILITGAARGIGLEYARMGLSSGARVVMTDVDLEIGRIEEQKLQVETGDRGPKSFICFCFVYFLCRMNLGRLK